MMNTHVGIAASKIPETLPVIFRADRSGLHKDSVTAVFPTLPADRWPNMTCYAHVGQHSTCSPEWYRDTRPALPREYVDLLLELKSIYERPDDPARVKLEIKLRITPEMRESLKRGYWVLS